MEFHIQPVEGITDAPLSPIEVRVVDSAGTLVPLDSLAVTILLASDSMDVRPSLSGTRTVPTHKGIAVFSDLKLDRAGAGFRLAANPPLPQYAGQISSSGASSPFTVLHPRGTHLVFRVQPRSAMAGVPLSPVEVVVRDSAEHDLPRVVSAVTVELAGVQIAGADTLTGLKTVAVNGGIARFADLALAAPASGLTLQASAFGMSPARSNAFDVAPRTTFAGSSVAAGGSSTCALDTGGAPWCWGGNQLGQLGEGREVSIPRPNPVAGDITFSQMSMTKLSWHGVITDPTRSIACGTSTAGVLYCWGGSETPFNGIDASTAKPLGDGFRMVGVGHEYACGLESGGAVRCWGFYTSPLGSPGARSVTDKRFVQLATGGHHACALTADGAAFCWVQYPETGPTPVAVPGGHIFQTITAGDAHTCGLDAGGVAWCWGASWIPLGDSVVHTAEVTDPVRVKTDQRFSSISAGEQYSCALSTDGRAWCWGNNWSGGLGDGTTTARLVPTPVAGGHVFTAISGGNRHSCGVTSGGDVWCWGSNAGGQLGNGTWTDSNTPVRVVGNEHFVSVSAGGDATCGVTTTGAGRCWGDNVGGQLGDGHPLVRPVPGPVRNNFHFTSISAGDQGVCGLNSAHETWCWGYVGDSVEKRSTPLRLSADPGFRVVSVGNRHGCGIDLNGAGWCWGVPRLGDGSRDTSMVPVRISGGLELEAISVGRHACALTTSGDVYCWGDLTTAPWELPTPTLVPGGRKFVALSGGADHDCALTASGEAYCWGRNYYGELGDGTRTDSPAPRAVVGGFRFTSISAGYGRTCAITAEQQAYCWRDDPTNAGFAKPTLVPGNIRFVSIDVDRTRDGHACGVATTGALYCWGSNGSGQLGNGATGGMSYTYDYEETPQLVIGGITARVNRP